jgi:RND superfamily putative drug exporter
MSLLGDRNWWLPSWLDRILPAVDLEGGGFAPDGGAPTAPQPAGERELEPVAA